MERTQDRFGWSDAQPTCAHEYILPVILASIARLRHTYQRDRLHIVDIGCGNGYVARTLAALGHEVTGIDSAEDGIQIARDAGGARFLRASVYDDDLAARVGGGADCAISLEVVEHLFRPQALFDAARQVIKPGGRLLVSTPYHGYLKNGAMSLLNGWDRHFDAATTGGHIKFFSRRTLRQVAARSGFVERRFQGVGRLRWLWKSMVVEFDSSL